MRRVGAIGGAVVLLLFGSACATVPRQPKKLEGPPRTFTSPGNRAYTIWRSPDPNVDEALPPIALDDDGITYRGKARKAAKLSLSVAALEDFATLAKLRSSLRSQSSMMALGIPTDPDSGRHPNEERNVRVTTFLVAASKEDDNDYHLILCHRPDQSGQFCMTAEVSGLPLDGELFFPALEGARGQFVSFFGSDVPGSRYDLYHPPIPVKVTGSLFFDVNHGVGVVGPTGFKTGTSWEVHPISQIEFEP